MKLIFCIVLVPFASYRNSIKTLFKEIRRGEEKTIHYLLLPLPSKLVAKEPTQPPKEPLPAPAQPEPKKLSPILERLKEQSYTKESEEKLLELEEMVLKEASVAEKTEEMIAFIRFRVEKENSREIEFEGSFITKLNALTEKQLAAYISLLDFNGSTKTFKPLSFVFQALEHYLQEGSIEKIGNRLKIIFGALSLQQVKASVNDPHFWCLIFKRPQDAVESLNPEKWGALAINREKHACELHKVIGRFPEDNTLYPNLKAIAPHTSVFIYNQMVNKLARLNFFKWNIQGVEKKKVVKQLRRDIDEAHQIDSEYEQTVKHQRRAIKSTPVPLKPIHIEYVLEKPPSLQWADDYCLEFLQKQLYRQGTMGELEKGELFQWILEKGEPLLSEFQNEINLFFSDTLSLEAALGRLKFVTAIQFPFFIKLLGEDRMEALWAFEAKGDGGKTEKELKISRLELALKNLTEGQFLASFKSEKFFELLCNYPKEAIAFLSVAQLKLFSEQTEREEDILRTFTWFAKSLHAEIPSFGEKLRICDSLLLPRKDDTEVKKAMRIELAKTLEPKRHLLRLLRGKIRVQTDKH